MCVGGGGGEEGEIVLRAGFVEEVSDGVLGDFEGGAAGGGVAHGEGIIKDEDAAGAGAAGEKLGEAVLGEHGLGDGEDEKDDGKGAHGEQDHLLDADAAAVVLEGELEVFHRRPVDN